MDKNLIFDIGLHKGLDANFYLRKGFQVVGLEAVQELCEKSLEMNREFKLLGKFSVINKALYSTSGGTVEFFVNADKDDWGSLFQHAAEKGAGSAIKITVPTITLDELVRTYGIPYYMKCDIEGGDTIVADQLVGLRERPEFVSLEATKADDIAKLHCCGYDRYQLVNQYINQFTRAPNPPREGTYVEGNFNHEMSGLFGKELEPNQWVSFTEVTRQFLDWYDLRSRNANLALGWLDVHACNAKSLS